MTPADVLGKAADALDRRDLAKGFLFQGGTTQNPDTLCAIGAICFGATGSAASIEGARNVSAEALRTMCRIIEPKADVDYIDGWISGLCHHIASWNNDPYRTKDEVVSALRAAAVMWRAQNETPKTQPQRVLEAA